MGHLTELRATDGQREAGRQGQMAVLCGACCCIRVVGTFFSGLSVCYLGLENVPSVCVDLIGWCLGRQSSRIVKSLSEISNYRATATEPLK